MLSQLISHHLKLQGNGTIHPSDGRFLQIWVSCSCRLPNIPALIRGQLLDNPKQQQQQQIRKRNLQLENKTYHFSYCYFVVVAGIRTSERIQNTTFQSPVGRSNHSLNYGRVTI